MPGVASLSVRSRSSLCAQRFFRQLAVGDVDQQSRHPPGLAPLVALEPPARDHPAERAVGLKDAEVDFEFPQRFQRPHDRRQHPLPILGVDRLENRSIGIVCVSSGFMANSRARFLSPSTRLVRNVPGPGRRRPGVQGRFQPQADFGRLLPLPRKLDHRRVGRLLAPRRNRPATAAIEPPTIMKKTALTTSLGGIVAVDLVGGQPINDRNRPQRHRQGRGAIAADRGRKQNRQQQQPERSLIAQNRRQGHADADGQQRRRRRRGIANPGRFEIESRISQTTWPRSRSPRPFDCPAVPGFHYGFAAAALRGGFRRRIPTPRPDSRLPSVISVHHTDGRRQRWTIAQRGSTIHSPTTPPGPASAQTAIGPWCSGAGGRQIAKRLPAVRRGARLH